MASRMPVVQFVWSLEPAFYVVRLGLDNTERTPDGARGRLMLANLATPDKWASERKSREEKAASTSNPTNSMLCELAAYCNTTPSQAARAH